MTHPHHPAADTCRQRAPVPRRGAALLAIATFAVAGVLAACGGDDGPAEDPSETGLTGMERLGKRLFEDTSLSEPAGQSCSTCHDGGVAFADPYSSLPTSKGVRAGLAGNRNTPMAAYTMFAPEFHYDDTEGLYVGGQFLDGRAATLEAQAQQPFLNPVEMANPNPAAVVEKVRNGAHALLFREVFGSAAFDDVDAAYHRIAQAIAAFERTRAFAPFSSKF